MSTDQPADSQAVEETKQQIRTLVGEIAQLSRANLAPTEYYGEFLQRVINALAAVGGAVWILKNQNELGLTYHVNLRQVFPQDHEDDRARHFKLLQRVLRDAEALLVPPYSGAAGDDQAGNPTSYLLVLAPIRSDDRVVGVVEIFQRPTSGPASQRGYLRFLMEMCNHASEYMRGRRLQELTDWHSFFSEVDRFSRVVHETLDPIATAYTIANEGRRLIGCDRVSVALKRGRKCVVEAVSGQDTMDTRANSVVLLGKLATAVVRSGEPLWYTGSSEDLPPQIERAVHDYVDETHTKTVAVLPLKRAEPDEAELDDKNRRGVREREEDRVVGALIVEQIEDSRAASEFSQSVDLVTQHASRALVNATDHNNLFLMPMWRTIGKAAWVLKARTLPKTLAITAAVLLLLAALFVVPWRFQMEAKGKIRPSIQNNVYADVDGNIFDVKVKEGDLVKKGQLLVEMVDPKLSAQIAQIEGELHQRRAQRTTMSHLLTEHSMSDGERAQQTLIELNRLEEEISALETRLKIQQKDVDALTVESPIDGQVITWDVENILRNRPVTRGQVLLNVADPAGPWELELYMEEDRMGHLIKALPKDTKEPMKVTYILKSDPKRHLKGDLYVTNIGDNAQLHEKYGHSVRLIVNINREDVKDTLTGTEVTAKIYCGMRPVGYVIFHEVLEFFQANVFF